MPFYIFIFGFRAELTSIYKKKHYMAINYHIRVYKLRKSYKSIVEKNLEQKIRKSFDKTMKKPPSK